MEDRYDVASALKDVDRQLPEAGKLIREYIKLLKSVVIEQDGNEERESK